MKQRIALLTLPLHANYGGILQCYALQTVLERMGCEVTVLNRRMGSKELTVALLLLRCLSVVKCAFRRYVLGQKQWLVRSPWAEEYVPNVQHTLRQSARKSLDEFVLGHIHLTRPIRSAEEMRRSVPETLIDAFVVGSDQVWRERYAMGITDFFLGFLPDTDTRRRVAYGASFGTEHVDISQGKLAECKRLARRFTAVSVREQSAVQLARDVLGVDARWVLDPTMLLQAGDYHFPGRSGSMCWRGLVTYILDPSAGKSQVVGSTAGALSLPVMALSLNPVDEEGLPMSMLPVEEWLSAFAQADFVVTDSFHGCVFSIINRKPFIAIANGERGMARFTSLLDHFGLRDRLVLSLEDYQQRRASLLAPIDYAPVAGLQAQARESSLAFLREALGC